jgi:hypothetical protein
MKLTPKRLFVGLALMLIFVIALIWFAWNVWPGMQIGNIVTGNPN